MDSLKLPMITIAAVLVVAGCSGSEPVPVDTGPSNVLTSNDSDLSTAPIDTRTTGRFQPFPGMQAGDLELLENNLIVYFEFDSSEIRSDFNPMLAAHARYLAANPGLMIRLEGHADERGTREYNIGLGDRRAQAVRQILTLQGASGSQFTTVSYGEERPAVFGSDDEAYSLNRRVELVYP